jgi:hypothetical protein
MVKCSGGGRGARVEIFSCAMACGVTFFFSAACVGVDGCYSLATVCAS